MYIIISLLCTFFNETIKIPYAPAADPRKMQLYRLPCTLPLPMPPDHRSGLRTFPYVPDPGFPESPPVPHNIHVLVSDLFPVLSGRSAPLHTLQSNPAAPLTPGRSAFSRFVSRQPVSTPAQVTRKLSLTAASLSFIYSLEWAFWPCFRSVLPVLFSAYSFPSDLLFFRLCFTRHCLPADRLCRSWHCRQPSWRTDFPGSSSAP